MAQQPATVVAEDTPSRLEMFEARFGVPVAQVPHALSALTHRSYCNEHRDEPNVDNERLEFLGDAVVDLAIGFALMQRFPKATEGELTRMRALLVNEEALAGIARAIGLGPLLLLGRGEELTAGRDKSSVLANALEAALGAIFFDLGMANCLEVVGRLFGAALDGVAEGRQGCDYKSLLHIEAQSKLKAVPRYRVIAERGPDHLKVYEIEVSINTRVYAKSSGRSKKEAEQTAAKVTLEILADHGVESQP